MAVSASGEHTSVSSLLDDPTLTPADSTVSSLDMPVTHLKGPDSTTATSSGSSSRAPVPAVTLEKKRRCETPQLQDSTEAPQQDHHCSSKRALVPAVALEKERREAPQLQDSTETPQQGHRCGSTGGGGGGGSLPARKKQRKAAEIAAVAAAEVGPCGEINQQWRQTQPQQQQQQQQEEEEEVEDAAAEEAGDCNQELGGINGDHRSISNAAAPAAAAAAAAATPAPALTRPIFQRCSISFCFPNSPLLCHFRSC
ncbi:unnamed protein product [Closterium sp. Naga37s-1]|nr:unnamed protein product [Closterium sp. Naga37s-1]